MIESVRMNIEELKGKEATIRYNLGRNKYEKYDGVIKEAYNYIFLVESSGLIKSFSYVDVLTKNVKIVAKNTNM